jgi:hypothetical protein
MQAERCIVEREIKMEVQIKRHRDTEKGVGLFIALFALMLLSAIGLAMVYAADTETAIDSNFRDQQTATYAAISGLQEARDRLILGTAIGGTTTVSGKIDWPLDLPSTSAANIIYIINPKPADTVAIEPWNPNNRYYDWELCSTQENMPSGFCNSTTHAPPGGNTWYTVIDDSDATQGESWHRTVPLDFKWVRINLKANNMVSSVPVTWPNTDPSMVCWSGTGQINLPSGYDQTCSPTGALTSINVPTGATGYTSTPTVTIGSPSSGGTQAVAHAVITPSSTGAVSGLTLTSPGTGYTSAPTVTISGGGGIGATAYASFSPANGHPVASVSLTSAGSPTGCFSSATPQYFTFTPGGLKAQAQAVMSSTPNCIASWKVSGACSSLKNTTQTVTTGNGGGSGFSGTIKFKAGTGAVVASSITNPGSGYTSVPTGSATTIAGGCAAITYTLGYQMTGVTLLDGGNGYVTAPTVTVSTAPVSGGTPTLSATLDTSSTTAGQITGLTLTNGGTGYTSAPTVTISGGGGSGGTATASLASTNQLTGFDFTCSGCTYGTKYFEPPLVTISGGGGPTLSTKGVIGGTTYYGQIVQVTAYAETPTLSARKGSRAMMQEELATARRDPFQLSIGGAITIPGPNANFGTPNSNNFYVKGTDANSCGEVAVNKPSIDVYDPGNSAAVDDMIGSLSRPDHYPGMKASPDVQNGTFITGDPTPATLKQFVEGLQSQTDPAYQMLSTPGVTPIGWDPSTFQSFTLTDANANPTNPPYTFVQGNATLNGTTHGSGILVVTGTLTIGGNYSWDGLVLVIGQGQVVYNGGGNGQVNGSLYTAKIFDSSGTELPELGTPTMDYSGGGGNGVQYDHCKADKLLGNLAQQQPPPDPNPLTLLSQRTIYR